MNIYTFKGKVLPERASVNITGLDWIEIKQPDSHITFKVKVTIILSQISATVKSQGKITDLASVKNYLHDTVSFLVDSIGFNNGCGYNIEITECTYDNGNNVVVFGVNINELENKGIWEDTFGIIKATNMATQIQQFQLHRALADIRQGVLISYDTGFYAYGAIEAIRVAFNNSWDEMNLALNLKPSYIENMRKEHGNPQRHREYTFMTHEKRVDMLIRAKNILSRFVSYIKNGNQPLNDLNFPELS